jgi:hypothetical protein
VIVIIPCIKKAQLKSVGLSDKSGQLPYHTIDCEKHAFDFIQTVEWYAGMGFAILYPVVNVELKPSRPGGFTSAFN